MVLKGPPQYLHRNNSRIHILTYLIVFVAEIFWKALNSEMVCPSEINPGILFFSDPGVSRDLWECLRGATWMTFLILLYLWPLKLLVWIFDNETANGTGDRRKADGGHFEFFLLRKIEL